MNKKRDYSDFSAEDLIDIKLLDNGLFYLSGDIEDEIISKCIRWIIYENLDTTNKSEITLYLNSYGGDLCQAFALIDIMKQSKRPIKVITVGSAMSAAFLIFVCGGTKGRRLSAKNSSFMCHQYSEDMMGKYHDLKSTMKEGDKYHSMMAKMIAESSNLTEKQVHQKLLGPTDAYLTPEEAKNFGIVDRII